jgi:DNA-directed RNA polymerase subunit RPC12/RpoP
MTVGEKQIVCQNCNSKIIINYKKSEYRSKRYSDYRCGGNCTPTPFINQCENCTYIFFEEKIETDQQTLQKYIKSDKYQKLYAKYKDKKPFFLIYNIYSYLKFTEERVAETLLFNYYYNHNQSLVDLKLLICKYQKLLLKNTLQEDKKLFYEMMIGEFYRRNTQFDKAKEIFLAVKNTKDLNHYNFVSMCDFQLQLIEEKKSALELFCPKTKPDYSHSVEVLDEEIDMKQKDVEIIDGYIFSFRDSYRFDEFKKGLDILRKKNIDLNASNEDGNMLFGITNLLVYNNSDCVKKEILKMFEIALLDYNVTPFVYAETEWGQGTVIDNIKVNFYEFGFRKDQEFVNKARSMIFLYCTNIEGLNRLPTLTIKQQHIALMTQLPFYDRVKYLFDIGYRFDKDFFINDEFYDNIIDYTLCIAKILHNGDFYEQETFPNYYDLIVLLIENALNGKDKENIDKYLKNFEKYLTDDEVNHLKNYSKSVI